MKNTIGIDIGGRTVHAAIVNNGQIRRVLNEDLPEGLVREGQIVSYQAMSDYLKELRKDRKINAKRVNLVLPSAVCYCRRFNTAYMTHEQLQFNLPYEFRDFVTGGKEDYFYDYAVVGTRSDEAGKPVELDLMAAAVKRALVAELDHMFKRAGFKLETAVPEELAYINLLRAGSESTGHGHCILDLGHTAVRLYIYNGDTFENIRALDFGCSKLVDAVSDEFNVDAHVAASYLESDYNGCARLPRCVDIYNAIAVEVTKAINFYRFNSGGGELNHIHLGGGAARNQALVETLAGALTLPVEDMSEFLPAADSDTALEAAVAATAVGAALQ